MARPISSQAQQALALYAQNNAKQIAAGNRAYSTTRQGYLNVMGRQAKSDQGIAQGYLAQEKAIRAAAAKRSLAGQQVLAGYGRMYDNQMASLQGAGDEAREGLLERYEQDDAKSTQSMISRGLGNWSIRDSIANGLKRDRERGLRGIDMDIQQQRGRLGTQLDQMRLGYADQNAQRNFQTQLQLADLANRRYGFLDQSAQRRAQGGYQLAGLAGQYANQQGRYPSLGELMQLSNMGQERGGPMRDPFGGGQQLASGGGMAGRGQGTANNPVRGGGGGGGVSREAAANIDRGIQATQNAMTNLGKAYGHVNYSNAGGGAQPMQTLYKPTYGSDNTGDYSPIDQYGQPYEFMKTGQYEPGVENPAFVSKGGGGGDYYAGLGSMEAYEQAKYFGGLG